MVELIVKILINAVALFVAVKVLPSNLLSFNFGNDWWKLLVALASDALKLGFKIGGFPPDLNADAIVGALIGAIVISIVSAVVSIALTPRRLF